MDARALKLAETTAVRLCHDLSGSVGAIMNTLELIAMPGEHAAEALQLAQEASLELVARLRLARLAWGACDGLSRAEFLQALAGLPGQQRVTLDLAGLAEGQFGALEGRLALNLVLMGAECLHGAGVVALSGVPGGELVLVIEGLRAAWPAGFGQDIGDIGEPRCLPQVLVRLLAAELGARVSMLMATGNATMPAPLLVRMEG